jgi:transcriptional regulator with XRE-family HTH domain
MRTGVDGGKLRRARTLRGWTQAQAAARLGLSQGYVSLLESGRRAVPYGLLSSLRRTLELPATTLPARDPSDLDPGHLARAFATLGYEPFGYLRRLPALNPAEVLLVALRQADLQSRLVEALPWLVMRHSDLDWGWLLERAKVHDVQNRLGYVLTLAREAAEGRNAGLAAYLRGLEHKLESSRLAREDTLCHESMTEAERRWLRDARPSRARRWNLLTDLDLPHLSHAG